MELKTPKHCSCGNTYFDGCGNGWEIYIGEEVEFVNFCPKCGDKLNQNGTMESREGLENLIENIETWREEAALLLQINEKMLAFREELLQAHRNHASQRERSRQFVKKMKQEAEK